MVVRRKGITFAQYISRLDASFARRFPSGTIARRCAEVRARRKPEKADDDTPPVLAMVVSERLFTDTEPAEESEFYESLAELGEALRWCRGRKRQVRKLRPRWAKKER